MKVTLLEEYTSKANKGPMSSFIQGLSDYMPLCVQGAQVELSVEMNFPIGISTEGSDVGVDAQATLNVVS